MSTGRLSSKKRPRNDLDAYLAEVESHLFCVTLADRRCLMRDLKAHVRELTTDRERSGRFEGRYSINREQLEEMVGKPKDIASMYINSVSKKIPSLGLRMFIIVMVAIFIGSIYIGVARMGLSEIPGVDNPEWLRTSGIGHLTVGIIAIALTCLAILRFQRFHVLMVYLSMIAIVLSIPFSSFLSGSVSWILFRSEEPALNDLQMTMFLMDFAIIVAIGLYLYLRHFKVMNKNMDLSSGW